MKAKQMVLAFLAAAAMVVNGAIDPSGDTSGANDAAAIQSAIDAAANGGTVTLGAGMFYINTQLNVTNGVTLAGQGWENTVIKQVATTLSEKTRVVTVSGGAKVERVTLTGGRLTGANDKSGGGAYISGGTVSWCCITNNSVSTANTKYGGGVGFSQGSGGLVDHCIIADNSVSTSTGNEIGGGGIGAYRPLGRITIDSCLISGNRVISTTGYGRGGGIGIEFVYQQNPVVIRNTTIVGNAAGDDATTSYGGGVFTNNDSGKKLTMINCIISGNTTAGALTSMHLNYTGGVDYCFFDIEEDKVGSHSLHGDPQFVDAEDGGYHLSSASSAREAGMIYSDIGVDLDNVDFGNPPSMGCYEAGGIATVKNPVFAPVSGTTFYPSTNVTLACATADASIYYTLDGSDPTDSSTLYDGPIAISATTTIKARAYKQDMDPSAIISATYTYEEPVIPLEPIVLGEVSARPGTDYNGNSVAVAFTGDIPAGAAVTASITIGGVNYAGVVDAANGVMTFDVPANVVTAGNTYEGTITLTVDGDNHTTNVSLVQGTPNVEDNSNWINETAATFGSTGSWSGDKAEVAAGVIAVSNAMFTASTAAPTAAVVTVTSAFCFGDPSDEAYDISSRAGITVVDVGGVNRYVVLTADGAVTNLTVVANTASAVEVAVTLDGTANTVSYSVGGVSLGTYPMAVKATGVSTVRYDGPAEVAALNGAYRLEELDTNVAQVGGVGYPTVAEALAAAGNDPVALLWDASWTPAATGDYLFTTNGHALAVGGAFAHSVVDNGNGTVTIAITEQSDTVDLRISEVGSAVTDPWGNTSSFIEIYNNGTRAVDIEGFILRREQKGKTKDMALPAYTLAAGAYVVVWGSDDNPYENPAVVVSGNVIREGIMKFKASNTPKITLLDNANNELDSFQMLIGLADGQSMGPSADFDGVNFYYFGKKKITPGAANDYDGATELGAAFVSETHSADEVALDTDITVTSTWAPLVGSTIAGVKMFYRLAFSNEVEVAMTDSGDGLTWTAAIPASVYASASPGSLVRWRFVATDSRSRTTKEPAFGSADSSPEYYGTITASGIACDLPVFHLFVSAPNVGTDLVDDPTDDPRNLAAMDIDSDALATASGGIYADMTIGSRCSIYHNGHFYDNVSIDLRGNTSAGFEKKSHGLKFNKSDKLVYVNPYTGETGTVRKTSFTAEFMDPSFMRQNVSFRFLNAVGSPAPFHYPVRLQRNGEFYQLGFHSIRFTDEIVDYYGWDDDCELVKNAGSLRTAQSVSGFETKIPEQENEKLPTENFRALIDTFLSSDRSVLAWDILNIPMWINYMAATRVTQECDDVFSNLCVYRHNKTGTWWPAAYDMNLSFGQYYKEAGWGAGDDFWRGEISNEDTFKCHPLYGGSQVRVYNKGKTSVISVAGVNYNYNGAFDSIYGDAKLRGMHLRRLRTLMDAWLKEPGTAKEDTPIWQLFASQTNVMFETACLDRAKWRNITSGGVLNIWGGEYGKNFRTNIVEGINLIWNNYIVPRRQHLYVTHSVTNATYDADNIFTVVEGDVVVCHNAGIPEPQPAGLKVRVSRRVLDADGTNTYIKVDNPNAIFLDVSGWTVSDGTTTVTLEPGTVIPPAGALYLVADRKAFTTAHPRAQVLLQGNIKAALVSSGAALTVTDADGATAATSSAVATAPGEETITEDADPFSAEPSQPVIGSRTGSDELVGLSIVKGEGDDDNMYLVIPFAAEAGFTYTLKTSTSLLTPVSEWAPATGIATISLSADGDAEFRVPMNGTAAFFVISAE